jgi:hypothetical protein
MISRRFILLLCLTTGVWSISALAVRAQDIDREKAAAVKAAYLLNFIKYTQWPETAFENAESRIVITIVGDCDLSAILADALRQSNPVHGRRIIAQAAPFPRPDAFGRVGESEMDQFLQRLRQSHLVYFCGYDMSLIRSVLDQLRGTPVLTVSDVPRFGEGSGMLGFVLDKNRIIFEANPKEIQNAGLVVSAKVLKLARVVETR